MQHAFSHPFTGLLARLAGRRPNAAAESRISPRRLRTLAQSAAAELAAKLLCAPTALMQLSQEEALAVVAYMRPHRIPEGQMFIREGDDSNTDFMLLVLHGEVTVESTIASRDDPITVTVLGAGSLIGEIGLIDGSPRSASCTATSDLQCAKLTRDGLSDLLDADPRTAAKLMMAISHRIAQRMRATQGKLKLYAQLTQAMNEEINDLLPR